MNLDINYRCRLEEETQKELLNVFNTKDYLIDPHTAVASCVAKKYIEETHDQTYMLIVSTANPYKFSDAVLDALKIPQPSSLTKKMNAIKAYTNMPIDHRMIQLLEGEQKKINVGKKEVYEYAVMVDTFRPLKVTDKIEDTMDDDYSSSWLED